MPHMCCEMQNKLSNTRVSPLGSMGEIISSRCPLRHTNLDIIVLHVYLMLLHTT